MSLGESIYLGAGELQKTQQVVLSGTTGSSGATVRWALRRETATPDDKPEATPEPTAEVTPEADAPEEGTDDGA